MYGKINAEEEMSHDIASNHALSDPDSKWPNGVQLALDFASRRSDADTPLGIKGAVSKVASLKRTMSSLPPSHSAFLALPPELKCKILNNYDIGHQSLLRVSMVSPFKIEFGIIVATNFGIKNDRLPRRCTILYTALKI
jgi:hypothetical protein